jgi:hypothetical protein
VKRQLQERDRTTEEGVSQKCQSFCERAIPLTLSAKAPPEPSSNATIPPLSPAKELFFPEQKEDHE